MKNKDLSHAPLAESVSYQGPLSGEPIRGRDHVSRFLGVYLPVINNIGLVRQIAEVITWLRCGRLRPVSVRSRLYMFFAWRLERPSRSRYFTIPGVSSNEWECGQAHKMIWKTRNVVERREQSR
jgi:hypothetical protein